MTAQHLDFNVSTELREDLKRWRMRALVVGVVGLLGCVASVAMDGNPNQFYHSYLWSYLFVLALGCGPLAWLMLQYITGGSWGVVIQRTAEAAARTLPALAVMFLPIVVGMRNLYGWTHAEIVKADPDLIHKSPYLNTNFYLIRAAIYLGGWCLLSLAFNRWSKKEDAEGHAAVHGKMARLAPPGLIFWCLSITFMSIDWVMSITPHWFSTMYGLLFIAGQGLTAMAFLITMMVILSARKPMSDVLTARHLHDLGKFLLALVMVWAYFSFSQFLIIWAGNLPEEIPWYMARLHGGWQFVALALVFCHFALPFALLLSRDLKRNFKLLRRIAVFVLCIRLVDLFWVVTPSFYADQFHVSLSDIAAPLGLIGVWSAVFLTQLGKRPLMPINDPNLEEALEHGRE